MATIALRVQSGLCNRLRSLLSGIGLARATNRQLVVWWPRQYDFVAPGDRCFDIHDDAFRFVDQQTFERCRGKQYRGDLRKQQFIDGDIVLATGSTFGTDIAGPISQWTSAISPAAHLQQQIDDFDATQMRDCRIISVLIRWAGNAHTKHRLTPPKWYAKRMLQIMHTYGRDVSFFLVCDCVQMVRLFRGAFPHNTHVLPKRTYRGGTTKLAYQNVISLYLMARTQYILGTYWSSFASFPTVLNPSITLETIKTGPQKIKFRECVI